MEFSLTFRNKHQEEFFFLNKRNKCFSGGYGNGKTYVGCQIIVLLSIIFPGYRSMIARGTSTALRKSTMKTFFKVIPPELVAKHSEQQGLTVLTNGSEIVWFHLDAFDEDKIRGMEFNSVFIDQAEEIEESPYLTLNARVGRWDKAQIPQNLPFGMKRSDFRVNVDGVPQPPNYMLLGCNPDSTLHWIWRMYHPDSLEWQIHNHETHGYVEAPTDPNSYDPATYAEMLKKDPEWVDRFIKGKWGTSEGAIHFVRPESILHVSRDWTDTLIKRSLLSRSMDHGDSAPTCCGWSAYTQDKQIIFYREYYQPDKPISYHREVIAAYSKNEQYYISVADPAIWKKSPQKDGSYWSVASEYEDRLYGEHAITWSPADNNEFGTRNRINELLIPSSRYKHPLTGVSPAPGLYFIARDEENPYGCDQIIAQTGSQKKVLIGSVNGKNLYSDERDDKVPDHAYDVLRYKIALHQNPNLEIKRTYPTGSMGAYKELYKRLKREGYYEQFDQSY